MEGLPWLLVALCEVAHKSTGFSLNKQAFGHNVHGPLAVLKSNLKNNVPPSNLFDYINSVCTRLVSTPDQKQSTQLCYVNLQKPYFSLI